MGCGASAAGTGGQVVHRGHGTYDNVVSIVLFAVTQMQVSTVHAVYNVQCTLHSVHVHCTLHTL